MQTVDDIKGSTPRNLSEAAYREGTLLAEVERLNAVAAEPSVELRKRLFNNGMERAAKIVDAYCEEVKHARLIAAAIRADAKAQT